MPAGRRKDLFLVTFIVGTTDTGVWDGKTGGKLTIDDLKYRPGGTDFPLNLGGVPSVDDLTLTKLYPDDAHEQLALFRLAARQATDCIAGVQQLGADRAPWGPLETWRAKINGVEEAEADSNANDAAIITLGLGIIGFPNVSGAAA